ncbi:hypothetical protein N7527_009036, partial [Penicillium freii]
DSRGGASNLKFSDLVPTLKGEQDKRPANLPGIEDVSDAEAYKDTLTEIIDDTPSTSAPASAPASASASASKTAITRCKKAQQA